MVRTADIKRGWGLFYSKSCKAREQEKRTHQNANYHSRKNNYNGSGVTKEKFMRYANEYGGVPQFNRKGEYEGFCMTPLDMAEGYVQ